MVGYARIRIFESDDFERGQRSGAGLRGNHATETRDGPSPYVIVLRTNRHQVLFRQHNARDRALVYRKSLRIQGGKTTINI